MKVAIVGLGQGWEKAPLNGIEIWGINQVICRRPVSKVVDIHLLEDCYEEEKQFLIEARKKAEETNTPIITQDNYPLKKIMKEFGTDYFCNSVAYAIALAIYNGYDEIDLYGVNQSVGTEYIFEKGGVEFWIGYAKGRGVKVAVYGEKSQLLLTQTRQMYGFSRPQNLDGR